jgi:hypothetical protein
VSKRTWRVSGDFSLPLDRSHADAKRKKPVHRAAVVRAGSRGRALEKFLADAPPHDGVANLVAEEVDEAGDKAPKQAFLVAAALLSGKRAARVQVVVEARGAADAWGAFLRRAVLGDPGCHGYKDRLVEPAPAGAAPGQKKRKKNTN